MKKNRNKPIKATNAVEVAAPASRWGKGVPGKGGKSLNFDMTEKKSKDEKKED